MVRYNALLCAGDEAAVRARAGARWVLVDVDVNSAAETLEGCWRDGLLAVFDGEIGCSLGGERE
jgi:hypothetical protein